MARGDRDILEGAVQAIADQAAQAHDLVSEAMDAGWPSHPVTIHAKMP
jgi:predicted component of type VI protein secretion system